MAEIVFGEIALEKEGKKKMMKMMKGDERIVTRDEYEAIFGLIGK